jgi:acetylglutamate kinase
MRVVKLGGSLLEEQPRRARALAGIAAAWRRGERLVLLHGGGKHVDARLKALGIPKRSHAGLRITDDATLEVVVAVLAGSVNKMIVAELTALGVRAAGISGADAGTLVAGVHEPIDGIDLGHVGRVRSSDPALIHTLVGAGILPVVSSIAAGPNGTLLNVNADAAAASIAVAVGAQELVFITDVPGVLDAKGKVMVELRAKDADALLRSNVVSGGMKPKLLAALHALGSGVTQITIGEGGTSLVAA